MKRNLHAGKHLNGGLSLNILTDDEVNEIHLGTLEILETTGLFIEGEEALDCFENAGATGGYERAMKKARYILENHKPEPLPDDVLARIRSIVIETEAEMGIDHTK